ncbi:replication factor C subunit 1-like [Lolium rigidum]|uniref:replication factor C subunit 1-like n=1 Tax=Lolium rigidum TaxID=89674 RepID=UPI001F5CD95E|nr:replication factor C subunit 1-like [Lolium rigidum]XP_047096044.1 replication factor C subunit 1-like [Lolium rigidum]
MVPEIATALNQKARAHRLPAEASPTSCLMQIDPSMEAKWGKRLSSLDGKRRHRGHPSPMDDIQPAVKSAFTKASKQGSSYPISRSNKYLRQETQTLKRVATLLEPFDESLPDKSGVASAKSVEEEAFDAENDASGIARCRKSFTKHGG